MKKEISIVATILMINISSVFAQKLTPNSVINASNTSFTTEQKNGNYRITVFNSKNVYHNKLQKNRNPDATITRGDKLGMLKAFTQVFNDGRLKQLLPEKIMLMTLYVSPNGRILEIEFLLDKSTLITASELETLEKAIKTDVWFKFRPEEIKGEDFIDIVSAVRWSKVLDGTLQ